jgi:dolichol-phosphate mannosyltransferase
MIVTRVANHPPVEELDTPCNDICILLPVLNEIDNIDGLIIGIRAALQGRDYVICIVDDGSRDGTAEFIKRAMGKPGHRLHLIQRKKTTRGSQRGSALHVAMMWALCETNCRILVEMDGDLSHRPEELPIGLGMIDSGAADVLIASKYIPGAKVTNRPFGRLALSFGCNLVVRALISPNIRDYSNGYRFYTREAARRIAETNIVYASPIYLTEVMAIWISQKLRIAEFPSHYVGRNEGLSKLRIIDIVKASFAIFEVAMRFHIRGFEPAERRFSHPSYAKSAQS